MQGAATGSEDGIFRGVLSSRGLGPGADRKGELKECKGWGERGWLDVQLDRFDPMQVAQMQEC